MMSRSVGKNQDRVLSTPFASFLTHILNMSLPFTPTRPPPLNAQSSPVRLTFPTTGQPSNAGLVAVITLCTPKNLNAMTSSDMQSLITALEWIDEQPHIVITVLTGEGRYLSAGANVKEGGRNVDEFEWSKLPPEHEQHLSNKRSYYASRAFLTNGLLTRAFHSHSKLLVAACNGPAVGIMAAVLGHFDLVYCMEDFFLLTPFSSLALVAEAGSSLTFARKMGLGRAQQALIEGRRMSAKELHDAGFVR